MSFAERYSCKTILDPPEPIRRLYGRDHLDHVLGTFGLLLFFNEFVRLVWGPAGLGLPLPAWLNTSFQIFPGIYYPTYRLMIGVAMGVSRRAALRGALTGKLISGLDRPTAPRKSSRKRFVWIRQRSRRG